MIPIWLIGIAAIGVAGCAPADKNAAPPAQPPAQSNAAPPIKSTANQVIEGFAGKTAVDVGQRTKAKIQDINTQRRENFEEIPP